MADLLKYSIRHAVARDPDIDLGLASDIVERSLTCLRPVSDAEILPSEAYTSEAFWKFERQAIFEREWLCVGHVNEIPNVGDHLLVSALDEQLLLVRTHNEEVKVLSAVCQHRGHPLVGGVQPAPPAGRCLNAKRLVCPYHNWVYNLDGRLVGAPSMDASILAEQLRPNVRLPEVRSQVFHGLVFITFNANPTPLEESLGSLEAELSFYELGALLPSHALNKTDLPWNWKLHHENAIEPYHTSYVHRGFHDAVPSHLTSFRPFERGQGYVARTTGFAGGDGDLFEGGGGRRLPFISSLPAEYHTRALFVSIMPTVVLVMQPTMVTVTFVNPTSASTMSSRRLNLYPAEAMRDPEMAGIRDEQLEQMKIIIGQDADTQTALQKAYRSRFTPRGRLSQLETGISQLNQWVVDRYESALNSLGTNIRSANS